MRHWDWQQKMAEFIRKKKNQSFEWGVNDCFLFVADGVYSITGIDISKDIRGTYTNEFSGMRLMNDGVGIKTLDLYLERKPLSLATVGDVGLFKSDREMFGMIGHGHGIGVSKCGYDVMSLSDMQICWSV